jgi:hypothetical protein
LEDVDWKMLIGGLQIRRWQEGIIISYFNLEVGLRSHGS